jgi:hypothetical protein
MQITYLFYLKLNLSHFLILFYDCITKKFHDDELWITDSLEFCFL